MAGPNDQVVAEIERLRREIEEHNYRYFVLDAPTIPDAEYDRLMQRLRALEAEHPELVTPDSPTQRVAGRPADDFREARHSKPRLSLVNACKMQELLAFETRVTGRLRAPGIGATAPESGGS